MLKEYYEKIKKSEILCFDFDGTIACSNLVKIKAFDKAIRQITKEKNEIDLFVGIVKRNFGKMNRYEMCKKFASTSKLKINNLETKICAAYSENLKNSYSQSEFVPGFENFLEENKKKIKIIVSSGDKNEIKFFLEANNILKYFSEIYDNTNKKNSHYEFIKNLAGEELVSVFGDSLEDYESSSCLNRNFFFIDYESHVLNDIHKNKIKSINDKCIYILSDYR